MHIRNFNSKILVNLACSFFIAVQLLFVTCVQAQKSKPATDKYTVQHFGEDEGLQNTIYSILPDNNGFLWIATSNGIARFNGEKFLPVFASDQVHKNGFSQVASLHYKSNDSILAYSDFLRKVAIIVKGKIIKIEDHRIEEHGLLFWNQKHTIPAPAYIADNYYSSVFGERVKWKTNGYLFIGGTFNEDTIWKALSDGIGFFDKNGLCNKIAIPGIKANQILSVGRHVLFFDKKNYLNYYSPKGLEKKERIYIEGKKKIGVFSNLYGDGFYIVADSCLYKADISDSGNLSFTPLIADLRSPSDISIIFKKDSNTIIIGTQSHGLDIYKKNLFKVSEPLPGNLSNDFFTQHLLPDSQTILTGSGYFFKNGIYYDKKIDGFDQNFFGIYCDRKGNYWCPNGKYILRVREIGMKADTLKKLVGNFIKVLLEDNDGRIWISSESEFGYFKNDQYTDVKLKNLLDNKVNCLWQDARGKYYIGSKLGLFLMDSIGQSTLTIISDFKSVPIRNILPEPDGSLWIFTYGDGFFRLTKKGITSFSEKNNELSFIHTFIEDEKGYCWLPSNNGLFVTTKKSLIDFSENKSNPPFFYKFSTKDGLRTNEFNGGTTSSSLLLPNGNISLTSMDGLVNFNPLKVHFSFSDSQIIVEQVLFDSTEIEEKDAFIISPKTKNIHFSIVSSYWGNNGNNVLEYQVLAKNSSIEKAQWFQLGPLGVINLFRPEHGSYQLIIRKRTGFGPEDYVYKTISFYILPTWYQTKLFSVVAMITVILALIGIFFWRRNYYRKTNRILKERIEAATFNLQDMNNTLEKKVVERTIAIQQAEKKFRTLVESSVVGVYIVKDEKFVYVNPQFAEIFGYTQDELMNEASIHSIVSNDDKNMVTDYVKERVMGMKDAIEYQFKGIKKNGAEIYVEVYGRLIDFEGVPSIIGTLVDVTERINAAEALEKSEANLHAIFNTTDTAYTLLNTEFQIVYANPRANEISRRHTNKSLQHGNSIIEYFADEQQKFVAENFAKAIENNSVNFEINYPIENDKIFCYDVRIFLIPNPGKSAYGIILAGSDITEKKLMEQEMQDRKIQEQNLVIKSILLGEERERNKIGQELHDNINQILAGAKLYLSIATLNKAKMDSSVSSSLELLQNAIEEIRNLSKEKVAPAKKRSLFELIEAIVNNYRATTNIKIDFSYIGNRDLAGEDLKVNIYRIIQEQINNILKHANAQNISINIEINDTDINLVVNDDGKGFLIEQTPKGIGLSNMINRVASFNGAMNIISSPGNGCTIKINFPRSGESKEFIGANGQKII